MLVDSHMRAETQLGAGSRHKGFSDPLLLDHVRGRSGGEMGLLFYECILCKQKTDISIKF